jgi:cytochrome o ubiquinol oxidase subunit 3
MSKEVFQYPGLNLGRAHPRTHDAAKTTMFGFWVFMMSDAILFSVVFATYVVHAHTDVIGPLGPADLYDIHSVFAETLLLLASSFTFGMASMSMKYRRGTRVLVSWLVLTLILGAGFLGLETHDFLTMVAKGGVAERSGFLSGFWDLVPLHGLHVTGASIWMLCLFGQMARYGLDSRTKLGVMRLALFWHFLDIIWIAIFSVVYLAGLS